MTTEEQLFDKPKEQEQIPLVQEKEKPKKKKGRKPLSPNSKKKLIDRLKAGKLKKAQEKANKQPKKETTAILNHESNLEKPLIKEEKTVEKKQEQPKPQQPVFNVSSNDFNDLKNELKSLKELLRTKNEKKVSFNSKETTSQDVKPTPPPLSIEQPSKPSSNNEPIIIKPTIQQKKRKVKRFR